MVTAQSSAAKKVHCTTDRTARRRNKQGNTRERNTLTSVSCRMLK